MREFIAIDIGGTNIKYGIVTEEGTISHSGEMATLAHLGGPHLLQRVADLANELKAEYVVHGVAISTAGQVDSERGVITFASSAIPDYQGCDLKSFLESTTGLTTEVDNDVNCAMLGECWLGAGRQMTNGLMMTVGTGIGGAILLNGALYRGHGYSAGEWGYMQVNGQDYQDIASTSALIRQVASVLNITVSELDGRKIFELAASDVVVANALTYYFSQLAQGIANLMHIFDPQKIIIGGGVAVREDFIHRLAQALRAYVPAPLYERCQLVSAQLGNSAGFCGAVRHFMNKHEC